LVVYAFLEGIYGFSGMQLCILIEKESTVLLCCFTWQRRHAINVM